MTDRRSPRQSRIRYGDSLDKTATMEHYETELGGLLIAAGRQLEVATRIALRPES